jgi:hypothetical protein
MWAVVQSHVKHSEFKVARFQEHPRINPMVLNYLFEQCANKRELSTLKAGQTSVTSTVGAMKTLFDHLKLQMDQLATKVAGNRAGGGDRDGGGAGRGTPNYRRNAREWG